MVEGSLGSGHRSAGLVSTNPTPSGWGHVAGADVWACVWLVLTCRAELRTDTASVA